MMGNNEYNLKIIKSKCTKNMFFTGGLYYVHYKKRARAIQKVKKEQRMMN